ncbi:hypothetical protein Poli38472_012825 [Pythium oligandrum]|uniref:HIT domain-containing protein n=1 Tax=Pythium oligandrum TaxID=41045 RepID=A0A8K1CJR3_PYTOL|nr:hypothetical protein Poli38472_012825 [Pythium oligandrum]|eukprot:TMW64203.1 hypothetical protein Poli38472_012825 [Pythium oligandrum]
MIMTAMLRTRRGMACVFCSREALTTRNRVVYEDELVVAIEDHYPRASTHLLVITREHLPSVNDLHATHSPLVRHMMEVGHKLLIDQGCVAETDRQLGFHRPPFTSVQHLHLHCLGLPFLPAWNRLRYTETFLGSYVNASTVLSQLQEAKDIE